MAAGGKQPGTSEDDLEGLYQSGLETRKKTWQILGRDSCMVERCHQRTFQSDKCFTCFSHLDKTKIKALCAGIFLFQLNFLLTGFVHTRIGSRLLSACATSSVVKTRFVFVVVCWNTHEDKKCIVVMHSLYLHCQRQQVQVSSKMSLKENEYNIGDLSPQYECAHIFVKHTHTHIYTHIHTHRSRNLGCCVSGHNFQPFFPEWIPKASTLAKACKIYSALFWQFGLCKVEICLIWVDVSWG